MRRHAHNGLEFVGDLYLTFVARKEGEAVTSPGDSGGPTLLIHSAGIEVVAGVHSTAGVIRGDAVGRDVRVDAHGLWIHEMAGGDVRMSTWINEALPGDVDNSRTVDQGDLDHLRNWLDTEGSQELVLPNASGLFLDVNDDGFVDQEDADAVNDAIQP